METKPSDAGYPEEQPEEVHDETTEPDESGKEKRKKNAPPDDGKSTGNPRN
jgi:hypothetical protein